MNAPEGFDGLCLNWLVGNTDLALEEAMLALSEFAQGGNVDSLKRARAQTHTVRGALTMLGLSGVPEILENIERLIGALAHGALAYDTGTALLSSALSVARQYLDDLGQGLAHQPMRLAPLYAALQKAEGKPGLPHGLFRPDLSALLPDVRLTASGDQTERNQRLHAERVRFQRGLLTWLKAGGDPQKSLKGMAEMSTVAASLEDLQTTEEGVVFWRVVQGLLQALASGALPTEAKTLLARVDQAIRQQLQGQMDRPEMLMRDALYFVAKVPPSPDRPLIGQLQATYNLRALLSAKPLKAAQNPAQVAAVRGLKEGMEEAQESWRRFSEGAGASLPTFAEHMQGNARLAQVVGFPLLTTLV
ncbi:MAG: hypothetical protein LBL69_06540, partial [Zoogloeaceae bacterium]|nr:hypothetical protein [Zoogloeaceae bacterium]